MSLITFPNASVSPLCAAMALPQLLTPQLTDLIWTAGFLDGEGCIHLSKQHSKGRKNPTYRVHVSVNQNHRASLVRVAKALQIPDRIYLVKRRAKMNRDVYSLDICDQDAHGALISLLPYLHRKRPEAEVAIAAYVEGQMNVHPGPKGHAPEIWTIRERHYRKLQRLK